MSDEVHFHLRSSVHKHNCRFSATNNPKVLQQHDMQPRRVTVRCVMMGGTVPGLNMNYLKITKVQHLLLMVNVTLRGRYVS